MAQRQKISDETVANSVNSSPLLPFTEVHLPLRASLPGWVLGSVSGVAIGTKEELYVVQRGDKADPVLVFSKDGELVRSWGKGDFTLAHSLRLDPQGNIWVIDAGASKVIKYTAGGRKLLTITIEQIPETGSAFRGATDIAFAPNGHVFITDGYGNSRVLEYTTDGKEVREWGVPGTGPGQFYLPHAIRISRKGVVYVADRENGRIEKFNIKGKFLGQIDHLGRCYALALRNGALWASISPMGEDAGAPGWLVELDPEDGRILGHLAVPEQRVGHALDVAGSGDVVETAGDGLLIFHRR